MACGLLARSYLNLKRMTINMIAQRVDSAENPAQEVAYLGPEGTYAHLVAKQRYPGNSVRLIPLGSVAEVFEYLDQNKEGKGIVPIENSSGGLIIPTIDGIIEHASALFIEEELSIDVKLALMSKPGRQIETIYSHFAPLHHCEKFLKRNYPTSKTVPCPSTSNAAWAASEDEHGAAIGSIDQADIHGFDVLVYPILEDIPNVTQFFLLGHHKRAAEEGRKTSLVVALPDYPGSLVDFLKPFADSKVNLKRIESRPIMGRPNTYNFLVELDGTENDNEVGVALKLAEKVSVRFQNVGSYPVLPQFKS